MVDAEAKSQSTDYRNPTVPQPRLLQQVRQRLRLLHYSSRTEQAYVRWIYRFVVHQGRRHPRDLGKDEMEAFLTYLAADRAVSAPTQNQAKAALLVLYKQVLAIELPWLDEVVQARSAQRLPQVLTQREARLLLDRLRGRKWLVCALLYGSGLQLLEALRLRVQDVEFERREIVVRAGKGNKDRVTMLPESVLAPLRMHLVEVRASHERELQIGYGEVELPFTLDRKYPGASRAWHWQ